MWNHLLDLFEERCNQFAEKTYLTQGETDRHLTYSEFWERSGKLAGLLDELGIRKGDIIAILLNNSPEFALSVGGALKTGAAAGPLNFHLQPPELEFILNHQESRVLITEAEFFPKIDKIKRNLSSLKFIVELSGQDPNRIIVHELKGEEPLLPSRISTWETLKKQAPAVTLKLEDTALILYTSGTTGRPKGALLSHAAVLEVLEHLRQTSGGGPSDVALTALPLFHIFGILFAVIGPLYVGAHVVILKYFQPETFVSCIPQYGVTITQIVPTIAYILLQIAEKIGAVPEFPTLTRIICGAAPLPVAVHKKFEEIFHVKLYEGYGLTEACMAVCLNTTEGKNRKWGSVGKPFPGFNEIAVFDEQDRTLSPREIGEVVVRGKNVMTGYLKDPEASAQALRNGWLHTGDVGYLDEDGCLYIVDRKKEMLIVGGENVYPREIEDILAALPEVAEAAVVGAPDEKLGEVPIAFVGLKKAGLEESELKEKLRGKLAYFKVPKKIIFVEKLPRNPAGKVLKNALKDEAQASLHNKK